MRKTGVSQKVLIINSEKRLLTLHRTKTAPTNPSSWDLPGGDIDFGEDAEGSILREIKEETGLEVSNLSPFDIESHIDDKEEFWVTIAYKATPQSEKVILSNEHDEFKWVSKEEFLSLKSSNKLKRFVQNFF